MLCLYLVLGQLAAFIVFTVNFLNIKPTVHPNSPIRNESIGIDLQTSASIDRLIFVVVDALRQDFVFSPASPMHYTKRLIANGKAAAFIARAAAPTVTLPRLKALTSGTCPVFLDFLANLDESSSNQKKEVGDSWVRQLHLAEKRMVFLGDDTWLRLFPKEYFDTVIVDRNVTRNLEPEFAANDWDVLIMHYLGVDHIGHVEGAKGPLMSPKLAEMDSVIESIHKHISPSSRTAIFILGDHGMTDSGNHGGSSPEEINTACVVIGDFIATSNEPIVIDQMDIAPTISSLFNVPIPSESLGRIILSLFKKKSKREQLGFMIKNLEVLMGRSTDKKGFQDVLGCVNGLEDENNREKWDKCIELADNLTVNLQSRLAKDFGSYNTTALCSSIVASLLIVIIQLWNVKMKPIQLVAIIVYCASVMSSSFIEEEHEIWNHVIPLMILASPTMGWNDRLVRLAAARILRIWNSNGYEYRGLPDIKLLLNSHRVLMYILLLLSLGYYSLRKGKPFLKLLKLSLSLLSFVFKLDILKGPLVSRVILSMGPLLMLFDRDALQILLIALNKTHNAFVFVLLDQIESSVLPYAYFSFGNSNLITSIDLSNSYIGLSEYSPYWVGFITFIVTFSGPIHVFSRNHQELNILELAFWRSVVQLAVMICCYMQRNHISVWTVFAPRLLFEVLWTGLFILVGIFGFMVNSRTAVKRKMDLMGKPNLQNFCFNIMQLGRGNDERMKGGSKVNI